MSGLSRQALGVVVAILGIAFLWFCLWTGGLISDTHTKTIEMHGILTNLSSARDVQIDAGHRDNAENISDNTNRLSALENSQ